jgi:hypothetical protein
MADLRERFEIMVYAMLYAKTFELSKNNQKILYDLFRHFKYSEYILSDFYTNVYNWYFHESNMK